LIFPDVRAAPLWLIRCPIYNSGVPLSLHVSNLRGSAPGIASAIVFLASAAGWRPFNLGRSPASCRSQRTPILRVERAKRHLDGWSQSADSAVGIFKRGEPQARMDRQSRPAICRRTAWVGHEVKFHSLECIGYFSEMLCY